MSGGTTVAAVVIALFFLRYWRQTGDSLFGMFAAGFVTFGLSRFILAFLDEDDEGRVFIYALRLAAFALILAAIVNKNRTPRGIPEGRRRRYARS
jgi:peptidoglycan/LPS O-acetylase OafA/YrhL